MTESLTKEERICLSTQWPPDTKTYLKLLRVHDELVAHLVRIKTELNDLQNSDCQYDEGCMHVIERIENTYSSHEDTK
jgi:hypothetical protein